MGRESSHGRKELFNLPPLVLKARAPNDGSAFCIGFSKLEVPEQTLGGIPLGLGMVMKIKFFEFSCSHLTSSSVLGGFITPADWLMLSLGIARFFVLVSLLNPFFRLIL